jgi:hypothetical protein
LSGGHSGLLGVLAVLQSFIIAIGGGLFVDDDWRRCRLDGLDRDRVFGEGLVGD